MEVTEFITIMCFVITCIFIYSAAKDIAYMIASRKIRKQEQINKKIKETEELIQKFEQVSATNSIFVDINNDLIAQLQGELSELQKRGKIK